MKKTFIFLMTLLTIGHMALSQKGPIRVSKRNIQTILLDLDDSTGGILIEDHQNGKVAIPKRHFELNSKRPVVFKIININPLRHNYFLNDELVTNFFDGNTAVVANNSYVSGANTVKEIPAINIFNFEATIVSDAEQQLRIRDLNSEINKFRQEYQTASDSLEKVAREISALPGYNKFYYDSTVTAKEKGEIEPKLNRYDDIYIKVSRSEKNLSNKISELQNILNKLSDKDIQILQTRVRDSVTSADKEFKECKSRMLMEFLNMNNELILLDNIINRLQVITQGAFNARVQFNSQRKSYYNSFYRSQIDAPENYDFFKWLEEIKYINGNARKLWMNPDTTSNQTSYEQMEESFKIIQHVFERRNKCIERCILNNSLEVGKLLEIKWIENSRNRNYFLNKASITRRDIDSAETLRKSTTEFFNYVKGWIADFALLNQSVKLDNKVFKSVHQNITDNCAKFLDFIRDLDHLALPNITEYTSPIYHNQKNVDMIRFKVDKQDKLTTARQTYEYDMWYKGGLKVDFSVGFLASGLVDKRFNKMPYYINNSSVVSTDSLFISHSNPGKYDFCFGGMVNLSRRNGAGWMNVGGSLGVAYSSNQKLQALAGLSFHMGKMERIILHAGVAFGTRKVMDPARITVLEGAGINIPNGYVFAKGNYAAFTIPDIERFTAKPFFGISYNLSKQNSLQAVKAQGGLQYYNSQLQ